MRLNAKLVFALLLLGILTLLAMLGPYLPYFPSLGFDLPHILYAPSKAHWLGQDEMGRDVLACLIYGARVSLSVALVVVLFSGILGTAIGLIAGYFGGKVDRLFIFLSDIFLAFPSILLIIAVAAFVPPSLWNIILILVVVGWVSYARIVRVQVLALKNVEYIQAAQVLGYGRLRILLRHLLPNVFSIVLVNASFSIAGVIIAESTLAFLGLGVPSVVPTWGAMLESGVASLLNAPHVAMAAGGIIMLTVLGFNFLGDGLRDYYAVKE